MYIVTWKVVVDPTTNHRNLWGVQLLPNINWEQCMCSCVHHPFLSIGRHKPDIWPAINLKGWQHKCIIVI